MTTFKLSHHESLACTMSAFGIWDSVLNSIPDTKCTHCTYHHDMRSMQHVTKQFETQSSPPPPSTGLWSCGIILQANFLNPALDGLHIIKLNAFTFYHPLWMGGAHSFIEKKKLYCTTCAPPPPPPTL